MPMNAANRSTIPLFANQALRFGVTDGRRTPATGEIYNDQFAGDLTLQFQNAVSSLKKTYVGTGAASGTFKMSFNGVETGAIAYNASAATIAAALAALSSLKGYEVQVTGTGFASPGYTVMLRPKATTGQFGGQRVYTHPLNSALPRQNLTISTNAVLDSGSAAVAITETDVTWANINPDGHSGAIVVKPRAKKVFALGSGAQGNGSDNMIGPFFRINVTTGAGILEIAPSDESLNIIRM